jgi:hypothetical protein
VLGIAVVGLQVVQKERIEKIAVNTKAQANPTYRKKIQGAPAQGLGAR